MSAFPETEEREDWRRDKAIATRELGLDYPLRFMSPAERVRMFRYTTAPLLDQIVRIRAHFPPAVMLVRRATDAPDGLWDFETQPAPLPEVVARSEAMLLDEIERLRGFFIGGLT